MIGCFNCPITGVRLQPTVDNTVRLQLYRGLVIHKAADAPITFKEIVKVMSKIDRDVVLNTRREISYLQATMYYFVYHINIIALY